MPRETYVFRNGKAVPKREAGPVFPDRKRSPLACPMLIRDTMIDGMVHPCTGQVIHSKAEFRKITREHGCVEVGNEALPAYTPPKPDNIEADIVQAWEQAEQMSEWDKIPEMPEEHPDLKDQSMTILAQPGQNTKELSERTRLPVREIEAPKIKTPQLLTATKN